MRLEQLDQIRPLAPEKVRQVTRKSLRVRKMLLFQAIEERPKAVLVEKPLCTPGLEKADLLSQLVKESGVKVFVGYNHSVSSAAAKAVEPPLNQLGCPR